MSKFLWIPQGNGNIIYLNLEQVTHIVTSSSHVYVFVVGVDYAVEQLDKKEAQPLLNWLSNSGENWIT